MSQAVTLSRGALGGPPVARSRRFGGALTLALVVGLALALRLIFPTADPPEIGVVGTPWVDEGAWVAAARNHMLFDTWQLNRWNPLHISPLFTGLVSASYMVFGMGTWAARLPSMLVGAFLPLLAFATLRQEDRRAAWIAALLMATDFTLVSYSRIAVLEATMVTVLAVAAWCLAHGLRDKTSRATGSWGWLCAAGAASVAAITAKASALFFPIAVALALGGFGLLERLGTARGRRYGVALAWYALGFAGAAGLWTLVWVLPTWDEFTFYQFHYASERVTPSPAGLISNALLFPVSKTLFARIPLATLFGVAAMLALLTAALGCLGGNPRNDRVQDAELSPATAWRSRLAPVDLIHASWFWVGAATVIVFDTYKANRYVMLLPPLILLAARQLAELAPRSERASDAEAPDRLNAARAIGDTITRRLPRGWQLVWVLLSVYPLYILWGGLLAALPLRMRWLSPLAVLLAGVSAVWLVQRSQRLRVLLSPADAGSSTDTTCSPVANSRARHGASLIGKLTSVWTQPSDRAWTTPCCSHVVIVLLVGVTVALNLGQFAHWASTRTYTIIDASRQIGRVVGAGTPVHGAPAVSLSMENRTRAYMVHQNITDLSEELSRDTPWLVTYGAPTGKDLDSQFATVLRHRLSGAVPVLRVPVSDPLFIGSNVATLWRVQDHRVP